MTTEKKTKPQTGWMIRLDVGEEEQVARYESAMLKKHREHSPSMAQRPRNETLKDLVLRGLAQWEHIEGGHK